MKIIIAGTIIIDYIKSINQFPKLSMLEKITDISINVGGCVPNTATTLKRLSKDVKVYACGLIGDDKEGEYILDFLNKEKIDTSLINVEKERTSYTDVFTISSGERTFFHYSGANDLFELNIEEIKKINPKIIHVGYPLLLKKLDKKDELFGTVLARQLSQLQSLGIKTSLDLVSENTPRFKNIVIPSLKFINYLIINEVEAGYLTNIQIRDVNNSLILENIKQAMFQLKVHGVKDWVVIHCPEMGLILDENNEIHFLGTHLLSKNYIKGTVGAGDAFCAGILYSLLSQVDAKQGLEIASSVASVNLAGIDSTSAATSIEHTMEIVQRFRRRKI